MRKLHTSKQFISTIWRNRNRMPGIDEKKICFIMCANDARYASECMRYIEALNVPDGYTTDVLAVWEAESMTSGYQAAMNATDAKYKVYLHQDVFIVNKNFLSDILRIFEDKEIGMIGAVGVEELPECGVHWYGNPFGAIYACNGELAGESQFNCITGEYKVVDAVDGLIMITQYDVNWREDLFKEWDFYDISQSQEFKRAGYHVVVPHQRKPWCIHDDGVLNLSRYYRNRRIYRQEYTNK